MNRLISVIILFLAMSMPIIFVTSYGFMNTYSNSIPKLAELVINNGHFNSDPIKENTGLAKELNFRSYFFVPYVELATLSLITGIPPPIMKTLPIGLFLLFLLWVLGRSLGISSIFSALAVLFIGLVLEIIPGLTEYSEFSVGFIFLLLFLILQIRLTSESREEAEPSRRSLVLLMIMLLVCSHFCYYSTEFMATVWFCTITFMFMAFKISQTRTPIALSLFFIILLLNSPIVDDFVRFVSFPTLQLSYQLRMGSSLLIMNNSIKVALIGFLALLCFVYNMRQRNRRQLIIFLAFAVLVLSEHAAYISFSGLFNVLVIARSYWIFVPVFAFMYLSYRWARSTRRTVKMSIMLCVLLLLIPAASTYYLRLASNSYWALPDIKQSQIFTPASIFIRDFSTTNNTIFSGHDLAFLLLLWSDPMRSSRIFTFGSHVWDIETRTHESFGNRSILMISSFYQTVQPIQGQRNINVRPPSPTLSNELGKNIFVNKIYDDGNVYLFYVR